VCVTDGSRPRPIPLPREHDGALSVARVLLGRERVILARAHPEADVDRPRGEDAVFLDEVVVHGAAGDDLAGDVVPDREVVFGLKTISVSRRPTSASCTS